MIWKKIKWNHTFKKDMKYNTKISKKWKSEKKGTEKEKKIKNQEWAIKYFCKI
jgi:hypothetical protein